MGIAVLDEVPWAGEMPSQAPSSALPLSIAHQPAMLPQVGQYRLRVQLSHSAA